MNTITSITQYSPVTTSATTKESGQQPVTRETAEQCIETLLRYIGEDPGRDGLKDTPKRVVKALEEMTAGYDEKPEDMLSTTFDLDTSLDQIVLLDAIHFTSLCEHHMLPFSGIASVGYIPNPLAERPVVGLSKLARLVSCFARRLQVQERMTEQIAESLNDSLKPLGVGVVIRAKHSCMSCRGVRLENSCMVTSAMRGSLREDRELRQEFLSYIESR